MIFPQKLQLAEIDNLRSLSTVNKHLIADVLEFSIKSLRNVSSASFPVCPFKPEVVSTYGDASRISTLLNFSPCQWNLVKTFKNEAKIAPITKCVLVFFTDLLNDQK